MSTEVNNVAYIDGQNLYMATAKSSPKWNIDFAKFRRYLTEKYQVEYAYYFLGFVIDEMDPLYRKIQKAGFVLVFREHHSKMLSNKKGNVDGDIILDIMKNMYYKEVPGKIILVSNDGDYRKLVDFLIQEKKFLKVLHPSQKYASSLYKKLGSEYYDYLDRPDLKSRLQQQKKKGS